MPDREKMQRVSRKTPCPICGKPDWCLIAPDKTAVICQRVQEGSVKRCGDAGWLHILIERGSNYKRPNKYSSRISIDFGKEKDFSSLAGLYKQQLTKEKLQQLTKQLKISTESLTKLNIGWDGKAYTFPMSNAKGRIIGIRRRFPNGSKASLNGSKTGLFIPDDLLCGGLCLVCEGTTDTAAALDLGFNAIGRPNCNSLIKMTASAVKDYEEIVIVADNDTAGKTGAEKLADYLAVRCQKVKVIYPPEGIKDLRQWLGKGLTQTILKQIIEKTKTTTVQIKAKE
ncbi:DNA primase (bacterial type) [Sedimentisphaera cyanobacteriorum]|uniref:DNA primase (Bacterial type) n=1 Tax=Sedimentisphaera cyanobacteriorum TaxID=1940790 RepID=A0A1Q2HQM2_9BACT|nr:toprim domain-containing protein [Sedimentisphaera cyanobacteriorum]AQQ09641.1 DNA primase (bacterial type) [Sedimentisphaera cyanobacteriorum]